jgi:excisionase family DNA binding protein
MYSTREAAQQMGISERHLRLLLQSGEIKGKKLARDWVVLDLNYTRKRKPKGGKK